MRLVERVFFFHGETRRENFNTTSKMSKNDNKFMIVFYLLDTKAEAKGSY